MSELINFSDYRKSAGGRTGRRSRVTFNRDEFRKLLDFYSRRVMTGEWKDYAIDANGPVAVFSVFKSSLETPVYAIAKRRNGKNDEFIVRSGQRTLRRARNLDDVLSVFDKPLKLVDR